MQHNIVLTVGSTTLFTVGSTTLFMPVDITYNRLCVFTTHLKGTSLKCYRYMLYQFEQSRDVIRKQTLFTYSISNNNCQFLCERSLTVTVHGLIGMAMLLTF